MERVAMTEMGTVIGVRNAAIMASATVGSNGLPLLPSGPLRLLCPWLLRLLLLCARCSLLALALSSARAVAGCAFCARGLLARVAGLSVRAAAVEPGVAPGWLFLRLRPFPPVLFVLLQEWRLREAITELLC